MPSNSKLLSVNDLISIDDLFDKLLDLLVIHLPNLIKPDLIALLEPLEFLLEFLKLPCELLIVLSKFNIDPFELLTLIFKPLLGLAECVSTPSLLERE